MLRVKSFEFLPGYGKGIEVLDQEVNVFIQGLYQSGATDVDLKITPAEKRIIYTVIWHRKQNNKK